MTGVVATSERHAGQVGARILAAGGSAVDAAVATAAALAVTEPTSNGLGGDLFALVWDGGVHALAANGPAPLALDPDAVRAGHDAMPLSGWLPVTVPGQVAGWQALHARFGRLPWSRLLEPAVALAHDGFAVGPVTAAAWARAVPRLGRFAEWSRVFGDVPRAGARFRNRDLGRSLAALADDPRALYDGALAARVVDHAVATGGLLRADDLAGFAARWVTPVAVRHGAFEVVGMTAPTQGVVAVEALAILEALGRPRGAHSAIEAIKLAFADGYATIADGVDPAHLLDPVHVAARAARVGSRAGPAVPDPGICGGTVLLCASDGRQVASVIQSNFHGFGSGIVVPGTGIALQNRGAGFRLAADHPNALAPGKRPFHTILPGLLRTPDGWGAFGCMGGQMQPQGHVQLVTAWDRGVSAQAAIDAPRWRWTDTGGVLLESGFDADVAADLARRGHRIVPDQPSWRFGGAQAALPGDAGSDRRKDGGVYRAAETVHPRSRGRVRR